MSNSFELRTSSVKFGPVDFFIIGQIVFQRDSTGEYHIPCHSFDEGVKWILDCIKHMMFEDENLKFVGPNE